MHKLIQQFLLLLILLTACGPASATTGAPATATFPPTKQVTQMSTNFLKTIIPLEPESTLIRNTDGMIMVYVPAGEFTMGSNTDDALVECQKFRSDCSRDWFVNEAPPHQVYLDAYYIDKFEVSNAQYKICVESGGCVQPLENSYSRSSYYGNSQYDDYPVIYVNWNLAQAYCEWAGATLPTEAQWEKAARGTDGRTYPWGEGIDCEKANFGICNKGDTTTVGSYPDGASPYGALDMAGNVMEHVNDWYDSEYYLQSPLKNPKGPSNGNGHVVRDGAWTSYAFSLRTSARNHSDVAGKAIIYTIGFRCAHSGTIP